jgi:hypothetical protein
VVTNPAGEASPARATTRRRPGSPVAAPCRRCRVAKHAPDTSREHDGGRAVAAQALRDACRRCRVRRIGHHRHAHPPQCRHGLAEHTSGKQAAVAPRGGARYGEDLEVLGERAVLEPVIEDEGMGTTALDATRPASYRLSPTTTGVPGSCSARSLGSSPASLAESRTPSRSATTRTPRVRRP